MDYYDNEYRRQYCRERIARSREEYRRSQAPPSDNRRKAIAWVSSIWERSRRQADQRSPAYRA